MEVERLRQQKDEAIRTQAFEVAARIRDLERKAKAELEEKKLRWKETRAKEKIVVSDEDIAYVVSRWTGIPLFRIGEEESEKLLRMESELHRRVIGQDEAIRAVSRAVRRSRAGLKNPRRPVGSFIFLGPTGVGKTELAKVLSEFLFGTEDSLIRIDMSEYMEKFSVSRLTGAPPGYVGYEDSSHLTEKVRRHPYSVILFDEIEKAHPEVFNLLLQILEDGHLTDNTGKLVDFKNAVVIMTSNLGARQIGTSATLGFSKEEEGRMPYDKMKETVLSELKRTFNPELLNRIDEVIVFHPLDREHLTRIVDLMISRIQEQLEEKSLSLYLEDDAKDFLIREGYDPTYGARPLRRAIERYIEDPLAEEVLKGKFAEGGTILVKLGQGTLRFELSHALKTKK
jgi:ATP-dependent Clp protease ATP-binding subunit ClpC